MEQLSFFWFLLMQSSLFGVGLLAVLATALVLRRPDRRRTGRLLILPAVWLAPLVLGGAFVEPEPGPKTADWLGYFVIVLPAAYLAAAAWCVATLPGTRWPALGIAAINLPFALFSAFVLGMASSGTWL